MIGDNRYNPEFVKQVKAAGNDKVIFLGYVFGARYKALLKDSIAYIRAAEVGGASPAVIEAMGQGVCVIANDKSANREILHDTGLFYRLEKSALTEAMREVSEHPEKALALGQAALARAMLLYSWDTIAHEYFKLIRSVSNAKTLTAPMIPVHRTREKILMTGAGGMLGDALFEYFSKEYLVRATDMSLTDPWLTYLDVRDKQAYEKTVAEFRPDYIFHLAALTSLEECERNPENAYATNALAVKYAAQLANRYGAKLIYMSSAGVFAGHQEYYADTDEPHPMNVYGLTKQMGSLLTEYYAPNHLIIRPGWMMGGGPRKDKKFVNAIVKQLVAGKKEIYAVTDKFGTPSYTRDIAVTLGGLLKKNTIGTYNMVCSGSASRYDVAKTIIEELWYARAVTLIPVDSSYFADAYFARRPASENLLTDRLNAEGLNRMRPWQAALRDYLRKDFAQAYRTEKIELAHTEDLRWLTIPNA